MSEKNKQEDQQYLGVVSQYVKDLSFENITAVENMNSDNQQPKIDVELKVDTFKGSEEKTYYVSLITNIKASIDKPMFILELNYTGCFVLDGFNEDVIEPLLYIECARLLFPFARNVIANAVSDGGYPPLYLAPVNFLELYEQQKHAAEHNGNSDSKQPIQ